MKKIPLRKCLGCGEQKSKKELIRVVKNNEGKIFIDFTGKENGRGAYICNNVKCFNIAAKKKSFNRAFKMEVPKEVWESLEKEFSNAK